MKTEIKFDFAQYEPTELKVLLSNLEDVEQIIKRTRRTYTTIQIEKFYSYLDECLAALEREMEKRESNPKATRK